MRQCAWPILPFWIKGSAFRGTKKKKNPLAKRSPVILFHINGNALYNVGDEGFRRFYFEVYKPWVHSRNRGKEMSFDTHLYYFLLDPYNFNITTTILPMLQYTDIVQNIHKARYKPELIRNMYINTLIVHGGYRQESLL